ncbi:hypothetical protein F0562_011623 [Nyssa sinensis]|uniref:Uncharacterized protein n=1 Tax=Nyssa sinensis TaxID=561372 RepID=A0A5J4ZR82_9ASTE|nr:hypothetical protein F0562_011623 [Nyssa sinensis]
MFFMFAGAILAMLLAVLVSYVNVFNYTYRLVSRIPEAVSRTPSSQPESGILVEEIKVVSRPSKIMGNCMETCQQSPEVERYQEQEQEQHEEEEKARGSGEESGFGFGTSGVRIKIVLTKEELGWLMLQLENKGGKRLEDVLGEIEKGRSRKVAGWKPSLESIMESPEVLAEMDR